MEENIELKNNELENEEFEVKENSSEEVDEVVTENEEVTESQEFKAPTEEEIQLRIDNAVEKRLKRERRDNEKKNKSLYQIEETLKQGLGVEDREDILLKLQEFYQVPNIDTSNPKDEEFLGKAYAQEIIDEGDINEIEDEANRLASIPRDKRTVRENAMFNTLCQKLIANKQETELKNKGIDLKILENKDFNNFRSKLNDNVSIVEAVDMYNKLNIKPEEDKLIKEKPASPGSAKSKGVTADSVIKEYYTYEEAKQFNRNQLDKNPKLFEAIKKSMPKW